jgi:hypothetical protein
VAPIDHWALLATARLFRIAEREGIPIPREALFNHALQICHAIVEGSQAPSTWPGMEGSLVRSAQGNVPSTAAALEGLLAALTFLPSSHPVSAHVRAAADRGIGFLVRAQVKAGRYAGGLPSDAATRPDDGTEATRSFNAQATEIRIDYVQHALSAMIQYFRLATMVTRSANRNQRAADRGMSLRLTRARRPTRRRRTPRPRSGEVRLPRAQCGLACRRWTATPSRSQAR